MPSPSTAPPKHAPRRGGGARSRRAWLVLLPVLLVQSIAAGLPARAAAPACAEALLAELGWTITTTATSAQPRIEAGAPCTRADLAAARAAGDLRVALPAHWEAPRRQAALAALLDAQATRCAYMFVLGDAARRATSALAANPGYRFSGLQLGWIGFGAGGARADGWERFRSFGRGYRPAGANSVALDAFTRGTVRSECGVGRQVAQLATQRALYGDAGFDAEFSPGELSIGTFVGLHDTDSILLGRHAGVFFRDGHGVRSAALGRQAFMGVPGFVFHVFDKAHLDDIHNQAQNFIVADVDQAAARALAMHGGLEHYDALNRQVWEQARALRAGGVRHFERLLVDRERRLWQALDEDQRAGLARIDALLADPFYRGFQVYVHRRGVRPVGYHVVRMLDRNPRTPYAIELGIHNLHTTLYQRWIGHRLRACAGG